MRLIDADALIALVQNATILGGGFKQAFCALVNGEPTVEPERTGKWIKEKSRGQLYQCSACGNYLDFRGVNAGRGSANYCPNCGCLMTEE